MKIDTPIEAIVTSNLPTGDITNMSISLEGIPHLMNLLTNLYNNPRLAVIREYSSNGLDAHAAIGNTEPIDVTLPSWDSPVFVVQDYGIGMSSDDIRNIYAQYGASTKRDSNNQIGAFGLGCKSALTISNQFTVISIKNGEKTTALISKTETGINSINIVSCIKTDAPSGTTVKVPVSDVSSFNREADQFFMFSEEGSVRVDGEFPESVLKDLIRVHSEDSDPFVCYINPTNSYGNTYVIMGGVPYRLENSDIQSIVSTDIYSVTHNMTTYIKVDIGSVDLSPSREGLQLTDKTNGLILAALNTVFDKLSVLAQEEMDALDNRSEAWAVRSKWSRFSFDLLWDGEVIPKYIKSTEYIHRTDRGSSGNSYHDDVVSISTSSSGFIVYDLAASDYKKINHLLTLYTRHTGNRSSSFYITTDKELLENPWIADNTNFTLISENDVREGAKAQRKAERDAAPPKEKSDPQKIRYPVLDIGEESVDMIPYDEIPVGSVFVAKDDFYGVDFRDLTNRMVSAHGFRYPNTSIGEKLAPLFKALTKATHVVFVSGSRTVDAFSKRVPNVKSILPDVKSAHEDAQKLATHGSVVRHETALQNGFIGALRGFGLSAEIVESIEDESLKNALKFTDGNTSPEVNQLEDFKAAVNYLRPDGIHAPRVVEDNFMFEDLYQKYPLMKCLAWSARNYLPSLITYLNAVHWQSEQLALSA